MLKLLLLTIITYFAATTSAQKRCTGTTNDTNLQCQLTRFSPSMVVATMEDDSYDDVSLKPFLVSLDAKDFGGLEYKLSSCFLHSNIGGGSDEENIYEIPMNKSNQNLSHQGHHGHDHFYHSIVNSRVTFRGISRFSPNSTLGQFKVYCPLVTPNLEQSNIPISVTVTIGSKTFTQSSSECKFHPYKGIAKFVEVESNLSIDDNFVVKISGLYQTIQKNTILYVGFVPIHRDTSAVTLGTTGEYFFERGSTKCTLNGQEGLVFIKESPNYGIGLTISTTLEINQDYVISCSHMTVSITSGSYSIPSIAYVTDDSFTREKYSMAKNTFV